MCFIYFQFITFFFFSTCITNGASSTCSSTCRSSTCNNAKLNCLAGSGGGGSCSTSCTSGGCAGTDVNCVAPAGALQSCSLGCGNLGGGCGITTAFDCLASSCSCTNCGYFTPKYCGDGTVTTANGEQCDLGPQNGVSGSGCSSTCQLVCGYPTTGALLSPANNAILPNLPFGTTTRPVTLVWRATNTFGGTGCTCSGVEVQN